MKAEITMQDGRPILRLFDISAAEEGLLEHFQAFFPAQRVPHALSALTGVIREDWHIVGDRLPGMGNMVKAQDATR